MTEKEAIAITEDILTRGVGMFIDPKNTFKEKLIGKLTGTYTKDLVVKFGMDPTRPDIHLGHAVVLRKLRALQDAGCKIVFLIGDFTTLIGDPTGKSKVRPELDFATVAKNMETYLAQVDKILVVDRDDDGKILDSDRFTWMRNSDWFFNVTDMSVEGASENALTITDATGNNIKVPSGSFVGKAAVFEHTRLQKSFLGRPTIHTVSIVNFLSILRGITFSQLLERDMFQDRIASESPLFMHEMLYPVAQGIDSDIIAQIYGSCDLEVGGTDQTFNLLMGRKIMEMTKREPQAVLSFELLVGLDGKEKMSKSLDNYIAITDSPSEMFGKIMSLRDEAIPSYYELCTFTPMERVREIMNDLTQGKSHPKEVKLDLAQEIVEIYHGREHARSARESFENTFGARALPEEMDEIIVERNTPLVDALLGKALVASKTEFRRLIEDGAIKKNGDEKLLDPKILVSEGMVVKVGKHRFVRIHLK